MFFKKWINSIVKFGNCFFIDSVPFFILDLISSLTHLYWPEFFLVKMMYRLHVVASSIRLHDLT